MRKAAKAGCITTCVALFAVGGFGAYNIFNAVTGGGSGSGKSSFDAKAVSDTPPDDAQATKFARAFLDSWAAGPAHYTGAASDTDAPDSAGQDLRDYHDGLRLTSLSFGSVTGEGRDTGYTGGAKVTFEVTARVAGGVWTYPGALDVVQSGNGQKAVHWGPSVLYSGLRDGERLAAGPVPADNASVRVLARDGRTELTGARYPSLTDIAATIRQHAASSTGGDGGSGVAVVDSSGQPVRAVRVFRAPKAPSVTTTIDPKLQSAAEHSVLDGHLAGKPASVVALDRRNGHILAIAFQGPADDAINAGKAPGSTLKIITSAALFDRAGLTPHSKAPCTAQITAASEVFHNDSDVRPNPNTTIEQAFAESCNTAFIKEGFDYLVHGDDASTLHDEAFDVFGLGSWSIGGGVQTADPKIPADPPLGDKASQFIGQGAVSMSPLILASLAATVRDGAFHQPVILPGQRQEPARQPISARTAADLREMMRAVVTGGTAEPRLGDLPRTGAKTGTAEEGLGTNGWLTAYDDDIAVASLVEGGSSGVQSAGYVVRGVLTADR